MILRLLMVLALVFGTAAMAYAQNEESEEARLASEKAKRRHYAGGRDEQELTVQAILPAPARYPQDPKADAGPKSKEPAQEDLHD